MEIKLTVDWWIIFSFSILLLIDVFDENLKRSLTNYIHLIHQKYLNKSLDNYNLCVNYNINFCIIE